MDIKSLKDVGLQSEALFKTTLRHLCGIFLMIFDNRVYLLHHTAHEFLSVAMETTLDAISMATKNT
jgi:hypothetical protein